jgi:hypothetical protein
MISGKSQSVVVCQPDHIRHRPVILYGLMGCHIYLLGPIQSLTLQSCFETKVFVGAVSHTASITHCQKLELSCAVKQVWIKSSAGCQLNLHNQYKTVLHSSKGIILGPMNFTYDGLRRDIKDGGIDASENLFDEFVHWSGPSAESIPGLVGILQPSAFQLQTLPFSTGSNLVPWKLPVPEDFGQAIASRTEAIGKLREFLGTKGGPASGKIQKRLMDWIQESGQMPVLREYVGLTADVQGVSLQNLDEGV